jgi:hypothetical protein
MSDVSGVNGRSLRLDRRLHARLVMRGELPPAPSDAFFAVVDNIGHSLGFHAFRQVSRPSAWVAASHEDEGGVWGAAVKGAPEPAAALTVPRSG